MQAGLTAPTLPCLLALALGAAGCLDGTIFDSGGGIDPRDYLRSAQYTQWTIEVDSVAGMAPAQSSLKFLEGHVEPLVNKPKGVGVVLDQGDLAGQPTWTQDDLVRLTASHRGLDPSGSRVTTHLLFLNGRFTTNEPGGEALGVTVGYGTVAIFMESIRNACGVLPPCLYSDDEIVNAVLVHEFGHALGLVNRHAPGGKAPVPMERDHEDEAHPGHSDNSESVMYWAVDTSDFIRSLTSGLPTEFDADDRADLRAAGGR